MDRLRLRPETFGMGYLFRQSETSLPNSAKIYIFLKSIIGFHEGGKFREVMLFIQHVRIEKDSHV